MNSLTTIIIAEVGVNHNGSIDRAKQMIDVAADAGVDFVKFQTFKTENLVTKSAQKAKYQIQNTGEIGSQYDMLKGLELSQEVHENLILHCQHREIKFLSTAFDLNSIDMLDKLGLELFKIPSGEITNLPYLRHIGSKGKPIILSSGMATLKEIGEALLVLKDAGTSLEQITVLHCNSEYPSPMVDVNLRAMSTISSEYGVQIGYSDHTMGIEVPIAAVAMGAKVIEKHFTLDRNLPGPDHKASLEPGELMAMVKAIRNIEQALGKGTKVPSKSEAGNIPLARKSIVALKAIKKGDTFTEKNLTVKRPGTGVSPMLWDSIVGSVSKLRYLPDEQVSQIEFNYEKEIKSLTYSIEELEVGMEASFSHAITHDDVVNFAQVSGDRNPIHLNPEYSKSTRYGKNIAHGMMSVSYFSRLFGTQLPGEGCLYVSQNVQFKLPVYIGDLVVATVRIHRIDRDKRRLFFDTICRVKNRTVIRGSAEIYMPNKL